jgi:hypothetical protein
MLQALENQGRGDGPLAQAIRRHLADPHSHGIYVPAREHPEELVKILRQSLVEVKLDLQFPQKKLTEAIAEGKGSPLICDILDDINYAIKQCDRLSIRE